MMNHEQKNAAAAAVLCAVGGLVACVGMLWFMLDREPWQAVMTVVGLVVVGLGAAADN